MVQKIETGGTSSTRTPMLKFRMKFALCDKEARHMTHCASVESEKSKTHSAAIIPSLKIRSTFIIIFCRSLKESVGKNSRVARNAYSSLASPFCSPLNQEQFPSISIFCLRHFLRQARKAASNESLVIPTRGGALRTSTLAGLARAPGALAPGYLPLRLRRSLKKEEYEERFSFRPCALLRFKCWLEG